MLTLQPISAFNYKPVTALRVTPAQEAFTPPAVEILAKAYAWQSLHSRAWAVCFNDTVIGVLLLTDGMNTYELKHLLIDRKHQRRGHGKKAVKLLLMQLIRERRRGSVAVSIDPKNDVALGLFKGLGFREAGYGDPFAPGAAVLTYELPEV